MHLFQLPLCGEQDWGVTLIHIYSLAPCRQSPSTHSQIMWDNTSIMTKALSAGSWRGQPTLRWVFMLSHIPIILRWQRQKLANVHQGASLLRGRSSEIKQQMRRSEICPQATCTREWEDDRKKKGYWGNKVSFWRCSPASILHQGLMYIYLTRENAAPRRLINSHGTPQRYISRYI